MRRESMSWLAHPAGLGPVTALLVLAGLPAVARAQDPEAGKAVFESKCAVCHSAGSERRVGPGLEGVTGRRDMDWLIAFITGPDRLIGGGDSIAHELVAEYGMPMPNLGVSEAEARDILAYLDAAGGGGEATAGVQPATTGEPGPATSADSVEATGGDPTIGRRLFVGERRLANDGAACVSCHSVGGLGALGGGTLARELSGAAGLYGPGLPGVLENPPFPLMQKVYGERPLTAEEVSDLSAFLEWAAQNEQPAASRWYAFPAFGVVGAILLLVLASLVWRGRLRGVRESLIGGRR
jgi:mono/diheme cytochrome c family protein